MVMIETTLQGAKEIAAYYGQSWQTIEKLIKGQGFPATKVGGRWVSDKELITKWRRERILEGSSA